MASGDADSPGSPFSDRTLRAIPDPFTAAARGHVVVQMTREDGKGCHFRTTPGRHMCPDKGSTYLQKGQVFLSESGVQQ